MKKLALAVLLILGCFSLTYAQESGFDHFIYFPFGARSGPSAPIPTSTSTPTPQPVYELLNGDFENGRDGSWTECYKNAPFPLFHLISTYMQLWRTPYIDEYGSWLGWLGGYNQSDSPHYDTTTAIEQLVTIPPDVSLCFEYQIYSEAWWGDGGDLVKLFLNDTMLALWYVDSSTANGNWYESCIPLVDWWNETVVLRFEMTNDFIWRADFYIDNVEFRYLQP